MGLLQINIIDKIRTKVTSLEPIELDVVDVSNKHRGHSGWKPGGQTHFHITIVSDHFINKSKLPFIIIANTPVKQETKPIILMKLIFSPKKIPYPGGVREGLGKRPHFFPIFFLEPFP